MRVRTGTSANTFSSQVCFHAQVFKGMSAHKGLAKLINSYCNKAAQKTQQKQNDTCTINKLSSGVAGKQ